MLRGLDSVGKQDRKHQSFLVFNINGQEKCSCAAALLGSEADALPPHQAGSNVHLISQL